MTTTVIGLGSSPLMLMRAISLAEAGEKVTLLDRAAAPGGAWGASELLGLSNVEFGAHVVENRPVFYEALRKLGVDLAVDPCLCVCLGRRAAMGWTRAVFHGAVGIRALVRRQPEKLLRSWRTAARTAVWAGRPYLYPRGGAYALVQTLCGRLRELGGRIEFGVQVDKIESGTGTVRLATNSGDRSAARIVISSRAFAPVCVQGQPQEFALERGVCRNLILRIRGGDGPPFSYVEVLGHRRLKRLRDLSAIVHPPLEAPERILCIQHRGPITQDVDRDAKALVSDLVGVGLLSVEPEILAATRTEIALNTLTDATLARIERLSAGRIEGLPTTDLAEGFMDRRSRLTTQFVAA